MKFTIEFDKKWVQDQAKKGVRVLRMLEKWARGEEGVKLISSSMNRLIFEMESNLHPAFSAALEDEIGRAFQVKTPAKLVSYSVNEGFVTSRKSRKATPPVESQEAAQQVAPAPSTEVKKEPPEELAGKKDETEERIDPAKTLEELLKAVPACDSRPIADFLRETNEVIPMLKRMDALASFWHQHLFLAIDEGYGLSEFLKALAKLYEAHGLVSNGITEKTVREVKLSVGTRESDYYDSWDQLLEKAKDISRANTKNDAGRVILCIDIGAWQEKLTTAEIKSCLRKLNALCGSFTCVFRIPFVDSRRVSAVEEALSDILNIRTIVVSPVPLEDLTAYAATELSKRGFSLINDAHAPFEQWLLDEKRDDSFFGYRTVDKMVNRVIYEKALSNCRANSENRVISSVDLQGMLFHGDGEKEPLAEFDELIGLAEVKAKVLEIVAQIKAQRKLTKKGCRVKPPAIHMLFSGNPGTGKTTVARIVGRLLRREGVLRKGHLLEIRGRDLCGEYIGQTAPKTSAICRDAYGSVLFIDEAYSLFRGDGNDRDYGREALDTLVAEMENHRDDLCVILAGYTDEMETMLGGNAGLRSRIPFVVDFPNYSRKELVEIYFKMIEGNFAYEKPFEKAVLKYFELIPDEVLKAKTFSNARFVRNLYERTWGKAAFRSRLDDGEIKLLVSDLIGATEERDFKQLLEKSIRKPIGFGTWTNY